MRSIHPVIAALLLILVAVSVALMIYLWFPGLKKEIRGVRPCVAKITAAFANQSGVYVWLSVLGSSLKVDTAYLESIDGSVAAVLKSFPKPVKVKPGSTMLIRFVPMSTVEPGEYTLRIPVSGGDDATVSIIIKTRIPAAKPKTFENIEALNGTSTDLGGVVIRYLVRLVDEGPPKLYNITVFVCAKEGVTVRYVRCEIYNATMQPPVWVGKWYVFEWTQAYTYPDCAITYWTPVREDEQPITILYMVDWVGSTQAVLKAAVYYGNVTESVLDWLKKLNLVVLSPLTPKDIVKELIEAGVEVLAYMSIMTLGKWEPWYSKPPSNAVLGYDPTWGEIVVNPCSAWWHHKVYEALKYMASMGFTGLFLDNLDKVEEYPDVRDCLVQLVKIIRENATKLGLTKIMVNRGFAILDDIADYIDYLLFEDYITYYDFDTKQYRVFQGENLEWIKAQVEKLSKLREEKGLVTVLLSYSEPDDKKLIETICDYWRKWTPGWPIYIATIDLQKPGLVNPC